MYEYNQVALRFFFSFHKEASSEEIFLSSNRKYAREINKDGMLIYFITYILLNFQKTRESRLFKKNLTFIHFLRDRDRA